MKRNIVLVFILLFSLKLTAQSNLATVSGKVNFLKAGDTVNIKIYKHGFFDAAADFFDEYSAGLKGNSFSIAFPVRDYPQYIDITFTTKQLSKNLFGILAERGDNVQLVEKNDGYYFSGHGSEKYNISLQLKGIYNKWENKADGTDVRFIAQYLQNIDSAVLESLRLLDSCKSQLSRGAFILLEDDVLSNELLEGDYWSNFNKDKYDDYRNVLKRYKSNDTLTSLVKNMIKDSLYLVHSNYYLEGIYNKYRVDSCYVLGKPFEIKSCYMYLKKNFHGILRDGLVTWLIYHRRNSGEDIAYCVNDALACVNYAEFKSLLLKLKSTQLKGMDAYDFRLPDNNGKIKSLSEFRGKVVLLDFWYTGCINCKALKPFLVKIEDEFKNQPVVFASISIDKKKELWLKSVAAGGYTSVHETNMYTEGEGMEHAIIKNYNISSFPDLILIDKEGRISYKVIDPRIDNGTQLSEMIRKTLIE